MLARDKHSSLLWAFVNYGRKNFYNIGPWISNYNKMSKNDIFMQDQANHLGWGGQHA